ncbi:hypothetical protein JCGZ_15445 [Jatropha curcas]|uniref:Uncharacterized protein n=1 Tax=Jatropha curcas TaxID=180498 RepID=A0A067K8Y2_JATCU|nr:hypothetical protein JCGZ_15445 [Jatropha curcas]
MEVFTYTHTKNHDCHTFIDKCALGVNPAQAHSPTTVTRRLLHYGLVLMSRKDSLQSLECMSCRCPVSLVLVLLPMILRLLQIEMFRQLSSSHYHLLLIPILQMIPWSRLPTLRHIQQVLSRRYDTVSCR